MSPEQTQEIVGLVRRAPAPKQRTLRELGIPRSTYYRWERHVRQPRAPLGSVGGAPSKVVWNRLLPQEQETIVTTALDHPDLSSREVAWWVTDHAGFAVSESTVYRVLKQRGLIQELEPRGMPAEKEYRVKPQRPNEQWQSDVSYFFVVGWGWYYFISVLDDYSRYILAWAVKPDMTAQSISDVVQQAVEWTDMEQVPIETRARLLSDRGSGYLAHAFEEYLHTLSIRHIYCAPYHPQTNGKIERFHETLKARINLLVYPSPEALRDAMAEFIEFYNTRRYHEGIRNVTPADRYYGRHTGTLECRKETKRATIARRKEYNLGYSPGESAGSL